MIRRVLVIPMVAAALVGFGASAAAATSEESVPSRPDAPRTLYWLDHERGWHFYEDPPPEPEPKPAPTPPPPSVAQEPPAARPLPPPAPEAPEIVQFKALQKQLEDAKVIAIIRPSEGNVRRYMELEKFTYDLASKFSDVTQRVAWTTPGLDPTQQGRPVNQLALEVYDREQAQQRRETIAALSRTHVILFFFRSDCPYCHAFAPVLAQFQAQYGLNVVAVSVDGGGLPQFPQPRADNGISRTLQVTQVPAIFLAEPRAGVITPLGVGVLSEEQLVQRVAKVGGPGGTDLVPSAARQVPFQP